MQNIPLPLVDITQQKQIIDLVDIIMSKKQNSNIDTLIHEDQINKLVYQLYGLTDAEIKIIEESTC